MERDVERFLKDKIIIGLQKSKWFYNETAKYSKESRATKVAIITAFLFIMFALMIIIKTPPLRGYEISIYDAYPWYFWLFIIASFLMGQIILVKSAFFSDENDKQWVFGFLSLLTANGILLFLPIIRGYAIYGSADVLTQIGWIKYILESGNIGSNVYPADHIIVATVSIISNTNITTPTKYIPPTFSIFFIVYCYLLAKQLFKDKKEILITLAIVSMPLFGVCSLVYLFTPFGQSFFLIPFVIYLYLRSSYSQSKTEFTALLIVFLIFSVFLHPLGSLNIILLFLALEICLYIKNKLYLLQYLDIQIGHSYNLIKIVITTFFIWGAYTYLLVNSLSKIFTSLIYEGSKSEFQIYSGLASSSNTAFIDIIKLTLNVYGQFIILVVLTLFLLIYIIYLSRINKSIPMTFFNLFLFISFLLYLSISILILLAENIFQTSRIYIFVIFFSLFVIPSCFSIINKSNNIKTSTTVLQTLIYCLIFVSILYFSIFNLYSSPIVKATNEQVASSELAGMETFFKNRDDKIPILAHLISINRFYDVIYSSAAIETNLLEDTIPIDHFGYTNYTSFSHYYQGERYFLLNDLGRKFYLNVYPEHKDKWRFTSDDFSKLREDIGVQMIYTNGNLEIYLTKPKIKL